MSIEEKLLKIQSEVKAPKSRFNEFSKFNYRSCEDILNAVKPLLEKNKSTLTLADTIEEIGGRIYVKATATLVDLDDLSSTVSTTAFAREAEEKKGMDDSQITGSSSSYARKYALAGLFLLDDGNDADSQDNTSIEPKKRKQHSKYAIDFDSIREQVEMIDDIESLTDYYKSLTAGNPSEKQLEAIKKIFAERKKKL